LLYSKQQFATQSETGRPPHETAIQVCEYISQGISGEPTTNSVIELNHYFGLGEGMLGLASELHDPEAQKIVKQAIGHALVQSWQSDPLRSSKGIRVKNLPAIHAARTDKTVSEMVSRSVEALPPEVRLLCDSLTRIAQSRSLVGASADDPIIVRQGEDFSTGAATSASIRGSLFPGAELTLSTMLEKTPRNSRSKKAGIVTGDIVRTLPYAAIARRAATLRLDEILPRRRLGRYITSGPDGQPRFANEHVTPRRELQPPISDNIHMKTSLRTERLRCPALMVDFLIADVIGLIPDALDTANNHIAAIPRWRKAAAKLPGFSFLLDSPGATYEPQVTHIPEAISTPSDKLASVYTAAAPSASAA
jgi:hypothetical protein